MKFNKDKFKQAVSDRMYSEMSDEKRILGSRYFAGKIGISYSTLLRILKGKGFDVDTMFLILIWLKEDINSFIIKP